MHVIKNFSFNKNMLLKNKYMQHYFIIGAITGCYKNLKKCYFLTHL